MDYPVIEAMKDRPRTGALLQRISKQSTPIAVKDLVAGKITIPDSQSLSPAFFYSNDRALNTGHPDLKRNILSKST